MRPARGFHLVKCPTCQRKRHCWAVPAPDSHRLWTCSQGHTWLSPIPTVERIAEVLRVNYIPHLKGSLLSESTLYRSLRRT